MTVTVTTQLPGFNFFTVPPETLQIFEELDDTFNATFAPAGTAIFAIFAMDEEVIELFVIDGIVVVVVVTAGTVVALEEFEAIVVVVGEVEDDDDDGDEPFPLPLKAHNSVPVVPSSAWKYTELPTANFASLIVVIPPHGPVVPKLVHASPVLMSLIITVPADVPSDIHNSFPYVPSFAVK